MIRRLLFGWPQILMMLVLLVVLHQMANYNYLLFHTLVEMLRVAVLGSIFILAWYTRRWTQNNLLVVVGVAALCIGSLEIWHTLSYKGMGIFPGDDPNLPTQLWVSFRYLEAVSFLLGALMLKHKLHAPERWFAGFLLVTLALAASILTGVFPDAFLEGQGLTPFKIYSEYLVILIFLVTLVLVLRARDSLGRDVRWLLAASLLFNALSSAAFTRYADVFGLANEIGHYFLFVSIYLVYRALLVTGLLTPYELLFRDLKKHEKNLQSLVEQRTARLMESQALNQAFIQNSPAVIAIKDPQSRYTLVNSAFEKLVQRPSDEILGRTARDLFPARVAERLEANTQHMWESGQILIHSEEIANHQGEQRFFESTYFPLYTPDNQLLGYGITSTDVTDIRKAEARFATILRTSMDALVITDYQGRFLEVNEATSELSGYSREKLLTLAVEDLDVADRESVRENLKKIASRGAARFTSQWRRADGEIRDVEISVKPLGSDESLGYYSFVRDITHSRAVQKRLEFLAHYDPLTHLPNKTWFAEQLDQRLAERITDTGPCGLIYLDLDHFKDINDSLGHEVGDQLLSTLAERLQGILQPGDLISRYGGDEFLLLLDQEMSEIRAQVGRLQELMETPISIQNYDLVTTASIGVALYPEDGGDFTTLFRNADAAMYAAKSSGRNNVYFFEKQLQTQALEKLQLLSRLREALDRKELSVYYQPQYDLKTGRITGAEALLRWQHPELGFVSPGRFIPLAEDSGLINPIGEWVLNQACHQAVVCQQQGFSNFCMAVNLSAVQFRHDDLLPRVKKALQTSGLQPSCLELELTESMLLGDQERLLATLKDFKKLGIQLAVDDFGTGYSNLAYLKRFAVDKLKIDQSFVMGMDINKDDHTLVEAMVEMSHKLGLEVIAEGVETESILALLSQIGCDQVQGYYYSRPLPADEFEALLAEAKQP
ncbi:EAL domain-containing protein [Marinospirillum sp.]|uniref:bifunctional diguanylate cyclase/phosphodiesterase n=1 Tax=Marinospirillum sp. TaxID=2183934 RepID=UPI0028706549|nr:EAL domain-containing protein [Marinospirillum sp.]MDR9468471.1 EAL domain-containing protein [Marinospirillum sp.]